MTRVKILMQELKNMMFLFIASLFITLILWLISVSLIITYIPLDQGITFNLSYELFMIYALIIFFALLVIASILEILDNKEKDHCYHLFELSDKWTDSNKTTWWEYYCKYCLEIVIKNDKKKGPHAKNPKMSKV